MSNNNIVRRLASQSKQLNTTSHKKRKGCYYEQDKHYIKGQILVYDLKPESLTAQKSTVDLPRCGQPYSCTVVTR